MTIAAAAKARLKEITATNPHSHPVAAKKSGKSSATHAVSVTAITEALTSHRTHHGAAIIRIHIEALRSPSAGTDGARPRAGMRGKTSRRKSYVPTEAVTCGKIPRAET